jgi:hypothetical protein
MAENKNLFEAVTNPFLARKPDYEPDYTSKPDIENVSHELGNMDDVAPTGFFDAEVANMSSSYFSDEKKQNAIKKQTELISNYRRIAQIPEVDNAISEIVNEAIFTPNELKTSVDIDYSNTELTDATKKVIGEEFENILKMFNIEKNMYTLFNSFYVDGQLVVHLAYDDNAVEEGIKKAQVISPIGLYFNYTDERWYYLKQYKDYSNSYITQTSKTKSFDKEEIVRIDSGLYFDQLILGNLHQAIKPANMLQTLEDMLVPMRFSRSVSRRVFNVDVANLNNKKAEEVMEKTKAKFKYKKFYNVEDGTISNQQHVASLTEDYWFPNRDGQKGTTVDTIDETGNLGELGDIIYFKKKLYTSLKIPTTRITDEDSSSEFSFDDSSINREEVKFAAFVSRLRKQFLQLFYELLKRQLISKGHLSIVEWNEIVNGIIIKFSSENKFFEKMERETLSEQISQFQDMEEQLGKVFSYKWALKKVFKLTDDDIKEMQQEIEKEKKDPLYKRFYDEDDF